MAKRSSYPKRNSRPAPKPGTPGAPVTAVPVRRSKSDAISVDGIVVDALPNAMFTVELDTGHKVLSTLCGKMRTRYIRVSTGDRVVVELSPYDLSRGRITIRHR